MISKNVHIVDPAFYMPQLKQHRRIWIYLPESYSATRKRYPVIYMHDGQNLFDESISFSGEWGVDETLDSLGNIIGESIVVGIDNGADKRINEYSIYKSEKHGKAEGKKYVDFIVNTLKPFIDKQYRTKKSREDTTIAGSSLGGLISFYALLWHPEIFGVGGVFSPSFWMVPQIEKDIEKMGKKFKGKIYFYAGKLESEEMVKDMLFVFNRMNQHSNADMTTVIRTEGKHDEATWRKEFPLFYHWLRQ